MASTLVTVYLVEGNAWTMHFLCDLDASAISVILDLMDGFLWNFAWLDDLNCLEDDRSMFLKLDFHWRFSWWFLLDSDWVAEFNAWMHVFASQETSSAELPKVTTSYRTFVPSLLVVKRVAFTFVEFSVFSGFLLCFLADANYADRTLCKYLWVTGLLDFHISWTSGQQ